MVKEYWMVMFDEHIRWSCALRMLDERNGAAQRIDDFRKAIRKVIRKAIRRAIHKVIRIRPFVKPFVKSFVIHRN